MDQNIASKDEKIEELEAEIELLRAALQKIVLNYGALLEMHGKQDQKSLTAAREALGVIEQTAREKFLSEPYNPDAKPTTFQERMMSGGSENEQQASAPRTEYGLCDRCNKYHDMIVTCGAKEGE